MFWLEVSHNKGVLCIIHTVEHNYIYVLVHKENNNYMFRSYMWTIFWLSINTQPEDGPQVGPKHVLVIFFMY